MLGDLLSRLEAYLEDFTLPQVGELRELLLRQASTTFTELSGAENPDLGRVRVHS